MIYADSNKDDLFILYTVDSGQVKLSVAADDIFTDGIIDHRKVISLAASNEIKNNRSVLSPVVMDSSMNIIG